MNISLFDRKRKDILIGGKGSKYPPLSPPTFLSKSPPLHFHPYSPLHFHPHSPSFHFHPHLAPPFPSSSTSLHFHLYSLHPQFPSSFPPLNFHHHSPSFHFHPTPHYHFHPYSPPGEFKYSRLYLVYFTLSNYVNYEEIKRFKMNIRQKRAKNHFQN